MPNFILIHRHLQQYNFFLLGQMSPVKRNIVRVMLKLIIMGGRKFYNYQSGFLTIFDL